MSFYTNTTIGFSPELLRAMHLTTLVTYITNSNIIFKKNFGSDTNCF